MKTGIMKIFMAKQCGREIMKINKLNKAHAHLNRVKNGVYIQTQRLLKSLILIELIAKYLSKCRIMLNTHNTRGFKSKAN